MAGPVAGCCDPVSPVLLLTYMRTNQPSSAAVSSAFREELETGAQTRGSEEEEEAWEGGASPWHLGVPP